MNPLGPAAVFLLLSFGPACSPAPSNPVRPAGDALWLRGYARTIAGETILYHSPDPAVAAALLTRATDGRMAIEWETEAVPRDFRGRAAAFVWLAGLATAKGAHRFDLEIDGTSALAFTTSDDSSRRDWRVEGRDGVALAFQADMIDKFDELFGRMTLTVPAAVLRPGRPLRLGLTGEAGGSPDWVMVFEHALESGLAAAGEQALLRADRVLEQPIRVEIRHFGPPGEALVRVGTADPVRATLRTGYNEVIVPVPAVDRAVRVPVIVETGGAGPREVAAALAPVPRRELWLLPHSHTDIGYSDRQSVVEKKHWSYIEEAIALAARTADYPAEARFKWNVEVLWAVESYLARATDDERRRFVDAVRGGAIGLQALYANELTGICHPEELVRLTGFARKLGAACGVPIASAMITDIPSYTWPIVPALAAAGVRYLSSGPNYMPFLPDGGDRIGRALHAWGDRPFWWVSPSGREKILFWMAGRGYSWFHGLNMGEFDAESRRSILAYMSELASQDYPYDMVQVRYTIGGDNGPPDPNLPDLVREWNERYESPRLVIATSEEMFAEFERRHGAALPEQRGDFTPYWEDGAASTALETALNRRSAERLLAAATLEALAGRPVAPREEFDQAWRQVLLWDEHTWGAADSVSNPDGENARSQWESKRRFALEGDRLSRRLLASALETLGGPQSGSGNGSTLTLDVYNIDSWERGGLVLLPADVPRPGDLVRTISGEAVPSQVLSSGDLAFRADRVPPLGAARFLVVPGAAAAAGSARAEGCRLETSALSIDIDPETGSVRRFVWQASGIDIVARSGRAGLNQYLYVPGVDPRGAETARNARVTVLESGPLTAALRVEAAGPGANGVVTVYRVADGSDSLEIADVVDKRRVRDKESLHFAFPFAVPGGRTGLDLGWAFIRPELDQLPGSCRDFFGLQNAAAVANDDWGVALVVLDAPLVEIGVMTDETPRAGGRRSWRSDIEPSGTLYSYAMNNHWHTNYKADQEGPVMLRYVVRPHSAPGPGALKRIGMEAARPLMPICVDGRSPVPEPLLDIRPADVVVSSLELSPGGESWIARLYNASARTAAVEIGGRIAAGGVVLLGPGGEPAGPVRGPLPLPPFGLATVRFEKAAERQ